MALKLCLSESLRAGVRHTTSFTFMRVVTFVSAMALPDAGASLLWSKDEGDVATPPLASCFG